MTINMKSIIIADENFQHVGLVIYMLRDHVFFYILSKFEVVSFFPFFYSSTIADLHIIQVHVVVD